MLSSRLEQRQGAAPDHLVDAPQLRVEALRRERGKLVRLGARLRGELALLIEERREVAGQKVREHGRVGTGQIVRRRVDDADGNAEMLLDDPRLENRERATADLPGGFQ